MTETQATYEVAAPDVGIELEPQKAKWEYRNNALVFVENPTWEEAEVLAATLMKMSGAANCWLGDAALRFSLVFPEIHYQLWDDRYAGKTIMNRMTEAKKIPPPRRHDLSASIISAICGLDTETDQDTAIEIAERDGLTVAEVRQLVKEMSGLPPKPEKIFKIICRECGVEFELTDTELKEGIKWPKLLSVTTKDAPTR
ncbi:MAG: hypothetical protein ABIL06_13110 [Pseudomonadota bacterium]|uniref:Uncharacterized protein n=1 Tax=viral metagenome TaxID=1070528 RepID=A0A6H1ZHT0_9ZZZZ